VAVVLNIKKLCLANGDEYENVKMAAETLDQLTRMMAENTLVRVIVGERMIYINPEFIISLEVGGQRKLEAI